MRYFLILLFFQLSIPASSAGSEYLTRLMTFNIRYATINDGENQWEKRKTAVSELIRFYQPEIFGIQEGLNHQLSYLDEQLTNYAFAGVGRDDGQQKGEYSALFYDSTSFTLIKQNTIWLNEGLVPFEKGWDAAFPRICTYALFKHQQSGQKLWVFNTHLDHLGESAQRESARLLLQIIDSLNAENNPAVLMGDFNSVPESGHMTLLTRTFEDSRLSTQKTAYGPEGTYNAFDPSRVLSERIDYVLVKNLTVLSQIHIDDRRSDQFFISDHLPVMATVLISAP